MNDDNDQMDNLIELKRRRLRILERQAATYGSYCPPEIRLEIEDLQQELDTLASDTDEISLQHLYELVQIKRRRLELLERKAASLGLDTPPEIALEIEDLQLEIEQLQKQTPLENIPNRYSTRKLEKEPKERNQVFISYCHKDHKWLDRLQVHIKPLVRSGTITVWVDTMIDPGKRWQDQIKKALDVTKVAVLLVSADFLASDFVIENELPPLLAAAESEGAAILSVIVSSCRFHQTKALSQFQAVNKPEQPLNLLPRGRQEVFFTRVSEAVERAMSF